MKKIYGSIIALVFVMCAGSPAQAQEEKLWITPEISTRPGYGHLGYMNMDGTALTWGVDFSGKDESDRWYGYQPVYAMQSASGEIFVATNQGGLHDRGTIVKITSNGIQKLIDFDEQRGSGLHLTEGKDGYIYGVMHANIHSYIFRFRTDGSDFKKTLINQYGFLPGELLTTSDGEIMGITKFHIYKMKPDLSGITLVYLFSKPTGMQPIGGLVQGLDGYLYGATQAGGGLNNGVIYKIRSDGTDHQVLNHFFNGNKGRAPDRGLSMDSRGNLYGTTRYGGINDKGVIFTLQTNHNFHVVHEFQSTADHSVMSSLNFLRIGSDDNLYGTTPGYGGRNIFRFDPETKSYAELDAPGNRPQILQIFKPLEHAITVTQPKNNATEQAAALLLFKIPEMPGSLSYSLQLSTDPDFGTLAANVVRYPVNEIGIGSLAYSTTYYVRVKPDMFTTFGPATSFTTHAAEKYSFITKPADGSVDNPAPDLKVTANYVNGAKRYTIELSTTADFSAGVISKTSAMDHQRTLIFNGIDYATTYYGRMKTDVSGYGRVTSFTTMADPDAAVASFASTGNEREINVHPNPSSGTFNVNLVSSAAEPMQVSVTNLQGEPMGTFEVRPDETLHLGEHFEKGIYILRISDGKKMTMQRLVKN